MAGKEDTKQGNSLVTPFNGTDRSHLSSGPTHLSLVTLLHAGAAMAKQATLRRVLFYQVEEVSFLTVPCWPQTATKPSEVHSSAHLVQTQVRMQPSNIRNKGSESCALDSISSKMLSYALWIGSLEPKTRQIPQSRPETEETSPSLSTHKKRFRCSG